MANLSKIVKISWANYQTLKNGGTVSGQTYDANAIYLIEDNGALDIGDGSNLTADMKAYLLENPTAPILWDNSFFYPSTPINEEDSVYYYIKLSDDNYVTFLDIDWDDFSFSTRERELLTHYLTKATILYGNNNNHASELPIGSAGQVLKVVNGLPAWANEYSYTLPLATSGARGGIKIGYSATGANIPLQLSSEKAYVALTSSAIVSALGYTPADAQEVENYYLPLAGGVMTGGLTLSNGISLNAKHTNNTAYNLLYVNTSNNVIFGSPYFGGIYSQDSIYPLSTNTYDLGASTRQWNNIYGKTFYENGTALSSKYLGINDTAVNSYALKRTFRKSSEVETADGWYKLATITHNTWDYCYFTILVTNTYSGAKYNTIFDCRCADNNNTLSAFALNIIAGTDISYYIGYIETKSGDNITKIDIYMRCYRYEHPDVTIIVKEPRTILQINDSDWGPTPDLPGTTTMTGHATNTIVAASASKLLTDAGSVNNPVYFSNGIPVTTKAYLYGYAGSLGTDGWKTLGGKNTYNGQTFGLYVSYNNSTNVPNWISGAYASTITFGSEDTRGLLSIGYASATITFGGSAVAGGTDSAPNWYLKMTGTKNTTYDLNSFSLSTHVHGNLTNDGKLSTANRVAITDGNKFLTVSSISTTELGYLSGVTGNIQTQLNSKINSTAVIPTLNIPRSNLGTPTVYETGIIDNEFTNKTMAYDPAYVKIYRSSDGSTLTEATEYDDDVKKTLLIGDSNADLTVTVGNYLIIELRCMSYVSLELLYLYNSTAGTYCQYKIESSYNKTTWVTQVDYSDKQYTWPGHTVIRHGSIWFSPNDSSQYNYLRVWVKCTKYSESSTYTTAHILKMQWWGGYPAGRRTYYSVNKNQDYSFPANINAKYFVENGTPLYSKYLGINSTAVGALSLVRTGTLTSSDDENTFTTSSSMKLYNHQNMNRPANCPPDSYNSALLVIPTRGSVQGADVFQLEFSSNSQRIYARGWIDASDIPSWKTLAYTSDLSSYLALSGGVMSGPIRWAGASRELLSVAYDNATWKGGIKYSWSSNTTIGIWGKHNLSQFVWNAGTDFSSTDVNGTTTKTYDFQVGRDTADGNPIARLGGKKLATEEYVDDAIAAAITTALNSSY